MEIAQLTLGQFNAYMRQWIGSGKSTDSKDGEGFGDLELFNIMAGIPKKVVNKKP